jgi:hypothetical protein
MQNIVKWQGRFKKIMDGIKALPKGDNSSFTAKGAHYWQNEKGEYPVSIAKLVSWIFIHEEEGVRMKA